MKNNNYFQNLIDEIISKDMQEEILSGTTLFKDDLMRLKHKAKTNDLKLEISSSEPREKDVEEIMQEAIDIAIDYAMMDDYKPMDLTEDFKSINIVKNVTNKTVLSILLGLIFTPMTTMFIIFAALLMIVIAPSVFGVVLGWVGVFFLFEWIFTRGKGARHDNNSR